MASRNRWLRLQSVLALAVFSAAGVAWTVRLLAAQAAGGSAALESSFERDVKPFFQKNCVLCHNSDKGTAGIRVDQLDGKLEDRHIPVWEAIRKRLSEGTMPPK